MAKFEAKFSVDTSELETRLDGVKQSIKNKILRKAVSAGTKIVNKQLKLDANKDSKLLSKSVITKPKTYQNSVVVGIVGIDADKKQIVTAKKKIRIIGSKRLFFFGQSDLRYSRPSKYLHLVLKGHKNKSGSYKGNNFVDKAAVKVQIQVDNAILNVLENEIYKL